MPLLFVLALPGCQARHLETPPINAQAAAAAALAEYDRNRDGFLDTQELQSCPGLKRGLKGLDQNNDGRLSQSEIETWLSACRDSGIGLMEVLCTVTLDGTPLTGANVELEPESFLNSSIKTAKGTTNERGRVRLQTDGSPQTGCNVGIYRVRISKRDASNRELIPSRYNTQTQLGLVLGPGRQDANTFRLKSQ